MSVCVCVCTNCACTFLCVPVCVCVCVCLGIKRYERELSNTCLTKKGNGRHCMIEENSPIHFKCNENVSERIKRRMKPDKI